MGRLTDYEDVEEKWKLLELPRKAERRIRKMTNREWLNSLSDEDFAKFVFDKEEVDINGKTKEAVIAQPCPKLCTLKRKFAGKWDDGKEKFLIWLKEKRK